MSEFNIASLLSGRTWATRFWFILFIMAIIGLLLQPYFIYNSINMNKQVIVLGPDGTFVIAKLEDFKTSEKVHRNMAKKYVEAFYTRTPEGFYYKENLKRLFLKDSYEKALSHWEEEEEIFIANNQFQNAFITDLEIQNPSEQSVDLVIRGFKIINGSIDGKRAKTKTQKFIFSVTHYYNYDIFNNYREPYAVLNWDELLDVVTVDE